MSLASKSVNVTINKTPYIITPHPAMQALKLIRRIGSHIKVDGVKIDSLDMDAQINSLAIIGKVASAFCQYSEEHDPELTLMSDLFKYTQVNVNGKQTSVMNVFDDHYAGNWNELIQAITEVLKVNNFLQMLNPTGSQIGE